ncbi:MAG TPA: cytochrome c biogenesis protein CcsA [Syntrophomonadaceae bacterium]|nr:cytochrome c biogenesis protein CcsA [Syntrophomonadaceae bacterium]HQE23708.1 cytochrome c biogenesis protein CcsA [Syntrophomonadaceae bacterium]
MEVLMDELLYVVLFCYLASALLYFWGNNYAKNWVVKVALVLAILGCILHLVILVMRTVLTGMLPLTNGLEFLLSFSWITVLLYLLMQTRYPIQSAAGIVMLISALLVSLVAILMKDQLGSVAPLMPALKSPWLTVHVVTAAVSYSAFALAAGLAVVQFFKTGQSIKDDYIYLLVGGGFALLSLSIVLGAVWAEQAWGRYWSWDPKETWALITWIIYAIYLHVYRSRDWPANTTRWMVIIGFGLVLFTFFGVNYLLPGLHSYA